MARAEAVRSPKDALLQSGHLKFRGNDFDRWAESLTLAFARQSDAWAESHLADLWAVQITIYAAEIELIVIKFSS
jgi:hypothetical protein